MGCPAAIVKLCWAVSDLPSPPPGQVSPQPSLDELKAMLERQLDRQLGPPSLGCWPLLVALLGIVLGLVLLLLLLR